MIIQEVINVLICVAIIITNLRIKSFKKDMKEISNKTIEVLEKLVNNVSKDV